MAALQTPPGASEASAGSAAPAAAGLPLAGGGGSISGARSLRRMGRAITANRKATVGAALLALFILIAAFPGLIAHDNPQAEIYPRSQGPSAQHWLGTTSFGQDMFTAHHDVQFPGLNKAV